MRRYLFCLSLFLFVFVVAGCDRLLPSGPSPVVTTFYADANSVKAGVGTKLHWETAGGATAAITANAGPNVGSVALSGERGVNPLTTTTYTLTVTSQDGLRQAPASVTVTVVP